MEDNNDEKRKGNCKEGTSKEKKTDGDYDRIDRFMCSSNFLWNESLS